MNKKNIPVIVQLKQNNNYIVQGITQRDAGVLFDIKIMDGLVAFDYSGYSVVTLKIVKPDGTVTYESNGGTRVDTKDPVNGRLKLNIPTSCTLQDGMHFCTVGFGYDETTYFESTSFNYYVGKNIELDDEDIIGSNEYPILTNLIALVSEALSSEQLRRFAETLREEAEEDRKDIIASLIAIFMETLGLLEYHLTESKTMLTELNAAIARGASVDISTITALATKGFVELALANLDFGHTDDVKTSKLIIYHGNDADVGTLEEGELCYAEDTNKLYAGAANDTKKCLNEPQFSVSGSEPTDTSKLWIDTSGSVPVIKYYDGNDWISCNTAVFA